MTVMTRPIRSAAALCVSLAGCLSIDIVPQSSGPANDAEAAHDAEVPEDAKVPEDAEALADASGPEDAGLDAEIQADAEADAEATGPQLPVACTAGVTAACTFGLHDRYQFLGTHYDVHDDYIYWVDLGTTDERGNYQYDGAIMRTRIGVWAREVVVGSLDFYDEPSRRRQCVDLRVLDDHLLWDDCSGPEEPPPRYVRLSDSARTIHTLEGMVDFVYCTFDANTAYCLADGELRKRDVVLDSEWTVLGAAPQGLGPGTPFRYMANALYFHRQNEVWRLALSRLERGELVRLTPMAWLVDVLPGPTLVAALQDGWFGTARDDGADQLVWKAVAGSGRAVARPGAWTDRYIGAQGGWIYWSEIEDFYYGRFGRAREDGSEQTTWGEFEAYPSLMHRLSASGIVSDMREIGEIYAFGYVPFPILED